MNIFEDITVKKSLKLIEKNQTNSDFVILDVRTKEEIDCGYIANSIFIDFKKDDFKFQIEKLKKNKTYLVYCRRGRRSKEALFIMKNLEFKFLYNMLGGFDDWKKSNQVNIFKGE